MLISFSSSTCSIDSFAAVRRVAPMPAYLPARARKRRLLSRPKSDTSPELSAADIASAIQFDQFYTTSPIAKLCRDIFREHFAFEQFLMLEPSAGEGAFFVLLPPGSVGYDRQPKCAGVQEADFLTVEIPSERPIAVIGNPPFGKNSSMAIAFVNRVDLFADVVAFILPRTFQKKAWIDARLKRHLHLIREEVIPDDAFVFNGKVCSVPSVFQIWERRPEPRDRVSRKTKHPDFEVLKRGKGADFAIRRIGARAGRISLDLTLSPSSHYFLRSNVAWRRNLLATMWQLDFYSVSRGVAGQPSLSMSEIVSLYEEFVTIEALSGSRPATAARRFSKTAVSFAIACRRSKVHRCSASPVSNRVVSDPEGSGNSLEGRRFRSNQTDRLAGHRRRC